LLLQPVAAIAIEACCRWQPLLLQPVAAIAVAACCEGALAAGPHGIMHRALARVVDCCYSLLQPVATRRVLSLHGSTGSCTAGGPLPGSRIQRGTARAGTSRADSDGQRGPPRRATRAQALRLESIGRPRLPSKRCILSLWTGRDPHPSAAFGVFGPAVTHTKALRLESLDRP
jgi:hypothetical protein